MSGKTLKFTTEKGIDWTKWEIYKDWNPVDIIRHISSCIRDHDPDNINPDCTCALLADEFDGAEITQPLLAGLSASECKDAFKFDELANGFCNVDANNFKSALGPPGDTCISRDRNNAIRLKYCKLEDKIKGDGK